MGSKQKGEGGEKKEEYPTDAHYCCRVQNRGLMPGTGLFEMAAAAVSCCLNSSHATVRGLTILSPKVLHTSAAADQANVLTCSVKCSDGSLDVTSAG